MPSRADLHILSLQKPISAESLRKLRADAASALDTGITEIAVDVDDVGILDSQVISTLIALLRDVRARGASVELRASRKSILETLRITALDKVFTVSERVSGDIPARALPAARKPGLTRRGRLVASVAAGAFAAASLVGGQDALAGAVPPAAGSAAQPPAQGNGR